VREREGESEGEGGREREIVLGTTCRIIQKMRASFAGAAGGPRP